MTKLLTPDQRVQIEAHRTQLHKTRRTTVPALEDLLYQPIQVLDHGFVRLVDYMGDDGSVVQAAITMCDRTGGARGESSRRGRTECLSVSVGPKATRSWFCDILFRELGGKAASVIYPFSKKYARLTSEGLVRTWEFQIEF